MREIDDVRARIIDVTSEIITQNLRLAEQGDPSERPQNGTHGPRYCGSSTFRTNSANRGSERKESNVNSVFRLINRHSRLAA
jgi:hypothetical protein